jgi:hypothetical protein
MVLAKCDSLVNPHRFCPLTVLSAGFLNKFDLAFIKKAAPQDISFRTDGAVTERAREGLKAKRPSEC